MAAFVGESDMTVDHIDENKKNNNINNLRYATLRQNTGYYREKRRTDGLPVGIGKRGDRYFPRVSHNGNEIWLGTFLTIEEAVESRRKALAMIDNGVIPANSRIAKGAVYLEKISGMYRFQWTEDGKRKSKRFKTEPEALAAQKEYNEKFI